LTGPELLSVAIVAVIVVVPLVVFDRSRRRERALGLIARGAAHDGDDVTAVTMALGDPRHRQQLVADLARALDHAERWETIPVAARPPESVRNLASRRAEIDEIISLARGADAAPAGLALLELSLLGSYGSAVYAGDPRTHRELLWRIRYLLAK